jgi:hypothetical protein
MSCKWQDRTRVASCWRLAVRMANLFCHLILLFFYFRHDFISYCTRLSVFTMIVKVSILCSHIIYIVHYTQFITTAQKMRLLGIFPAI